MMKNRIIMLFTLLAGRVKNSYRCSQKDLYSALETACENFLLFQSRFLAFATVYTTLWLENLQAAIAAAKAMPEYDERNELHEQYRQDLFPLADVCLAYWQELKSHIIRAFPNPGQKAHLEAAGSRYYQKALKHDWESIMMIMQLGNTFMTNNLAVLTAAGMPAAFPDNFATAEVNFLAKHTQFFNAERLVWEARDAKVTANNNVYDTTMAMLRDGQKIFRLEPGTRKLFVFDKILEMIHGGSGKAADEPKLKAKTKNGPVNWGVRLTNGAKIKFNHGDNTETEMTGDGVGTNFFDKIYVLLKVFTIVITGKISEIIELHVNNSNLTYFKLHEKMKKLKQFIAQNNLFPTKVVDDILITINGYGTSGPDRIVNLLGNEPPSAAGLQAKAELESRGWIVLVAS